MVAIDSITAAAKIDPSHLPDGANMYSRLIYSSSGQRESLLPNAMVHPLYRVHRRVQHTDHR